MKFKANGDAENERYEYELGTDEYFVYTNKEKSVIITYGAGTLISTKQNVEFRNKVVDLVLLTKYGAKALDEAWIEFSSDLELTVTGQEFYTVTGSGSSVTLSSPVSRTNVLLTGDGAVSLSTKSFFSVNEQYYDTSSSESITEYDDAALKFVYSDENYFNGGQSDGQFTIQIEPQPYETTQMRISEYGTMEQCLFGFGIENVDYDGYTPSSTY
jgi:hypothetical protein